MKLYLDNCALGRLFDDQAQPRIRAEADAVRAVLRMVRLGRAQRIGSSALKAEIARNTDGMRRLNTQTLLAEATTILTPAPAIEARALDLQLLGFTRFDALHVAFAEAAKADALLTTDDRLIRRSTRLQKQTGVTSSKTLSILNPVVWRRRWSND